MTVSPRGNFSKKDKLVLDTAIVHYFRLDHNNTVVV